MILCFDFHSHGEVVRCTTRISPRNDVGYTRKACNNASTFYPIDNTGFVIDKLRPDFCHFVDISGL
jgi:hypothetical protein